MNLFYHSATDQYFTDNGFELNGFVYPQNWLRSATPEQIAEIGLSEVVTVGEMKDPKYYWNNERLENGQSIITNVVKDLETIKGVKLEALAAYRYQIETAGVTAGGTVIRTDRESQAQLGSAWIATQINPEALIDWKGANGWTQISGAQVIGISTVTFAYVQACFSNERTHAEAINALTTVEDLIAYDITTGWPDQGQAE